MLTRSVDVSYFLMNSHSVNDTDARAVFDTLRYYMLGWSRFDLLTRLETFLHYQETVLVFMILYVICTFETKRHLKALLWFSRLAAGFIRLWHGFDSRAICTYGVCGEDFGGET
jgi:hypothetical protein